MSGFGGAPLRHRLPGPLGEPSQLLRLARFRTSHAEVIIGDGGFSTLQARIPEPSGEIVITRYTLRELLDRLEEVITGQDDQPDSSLS